MYINILKPFSIRTKRCSSTYIPAAPVLALGRGWVPWAPSTRCGWTAAAFQTLGSGNKPSCRFQSGPWRRHPCLPRQLAMSRQREIDGGSLMRHRERLRGDIIHRGMKIQNLEIWGGGRSDQTRSEIVVKEMARRRIYYPKNNPFPPKHGKIDVFLEQRGITSWQGNLMARQIGVSSDQKVSIREISNGGGMSSRLNATFYVPYAGWESGSCSLSS